jgi:Ca2+-binding RTX toxin-like protein
MSTLNEVAGTDGDDALYGTIGDDAISGLGGGDTINGGGGNDVLDGGAGDDALYGGPGADVIYGGVGNDGLNGDGGDDVIYGDQGDDILYSFYGEGNDTLFGGDGNDGIAVLARFGIAETVTADGGNGDDSFWIWMGSASRTVTLTGGSGADLYQIEREGVAGFTVTDFAAGAGGDRIDVSRLLDHSAAEGRGYSGGNPFAPDAGYLRLLQDGTDTLLQYDEDGAQGGAFIWRTAMTMTGVTALDLTADNFLGGLTPDGSAVPGVIIYGTEPNGRLLGGYFNDEIYGSDWFESIEGGGGDDHLEGRGGDDYVFGGAGNDVISGGSGADRLDGGAGDDIVHGDDGADYISSTQGEGNDALYGDDGDDEFSFGSFDLQVSQAPMENVNADGGAGDDRFFLPAHTGSRHFTLTGGSGVDAYAFIGVSAGRSDISVTDFQTGSGGDQMDLATIIELIGTDGRGFTNGNPFDPALGYIRIHQDGADTLIQYDEDGAQSETHTWRTLFTLMGVTAQDLTAANFALAIPLDGSSLPGQVVDGSDGDDVLVGTFFDDQISGYAGDDSLMGDSGADVLEGGAGNDLLGGGGGNDTLYGGDGADFLGGATGDDSVFGGTGDDQLYYAEGGGNDALNGEEGDDRFDIWLTGKAFATLIIDGGAGSDSFLIRTSGGSKSVSLTTGDGLDQITFSMSYRGIANMDVTDFTAGSGGDQIDVTSLLDYSSLNGRGYLGGNPMAPAQGYLRLVQDGDNTLLQYDIDGAQGSALGWQTILTLQNVLKAAIGAHNFKPMSIDGTEGDDTLQGGLGVDTLDAKAGNDTLDGGWGGDTMSGGTGDDTYMVDDTGDTVVETDGEATGTDTVISSVDYTLAANVENLALDNGATSGTGNASDNAIAGNDGDNTLLGGGGTDTLTGGAGNDTVDGGGGNDIIIGGHGEGDDVYIGGAGVDTVRYLSATAGITVDLGSGSATSTGGNDAAGIGTDVLSGIENVTAGNWNDRIEGNEQDNQLEGADGNDVLVGGAGNDSLDGGAGSDTSDYSDRLGAVAVDLGIKAAQDTKGAGVDMLRGIENLSGSAYDDTFAGNDLANVLAGGAGNDMLKGNAGADTLDGGAGTDSMFGGAGNDTYQVDASTDRVYETATAARTDTTDLGGTDAIVSTISLTLGRFVENLTLSGSANLSGTGNDLANALAGNAGANSLRGLAGDDTLRGWGGNDRLDGGTGADKMFGGAGNDTYFVDAAGDRIYETATAASTDSTDLGGTDTVISTAGFTLARFVENLTLAGSININGTGNDLVNKLLGNDGANTLKGMAGSDVLVGGAGSDKLHGGVGKDTLTGGTGRDCFVFDVAPLSRDTITDFTRAENDRIQLSKAVFAAFTYTGTLQADDFYAAAGATKAHDATDRLIYNTSTGVLYYDADGTGGVAPVQIALLGAATHPALTYADVQIIA